MPVALAATRPIRLAGPFQQLVMIALVRLGPDTSGGGCSPRSGAADRPTGCAANGRER